MGLCLPELEKLGYYGLRCELKKESFILLKKVSIHTSNYFSQRLSRLLAGLGGQRRAGVKFRGGRPSEEKHGFVVFVNPALYKFHAAEQSYCGKIHGILSNILKNSIRASSLPVGKSKEIIFCEPS